jgi:hypothetical protein
MFQWMPGRKGGEWMYQSGRMGDAVVDEIRVIPTSCTQTVC